MWKTITLFLCIFYTNCVQATYNTGIKTRVYEQQPITHVYHQHQYTPTHGHYHQYEGSNDRDYQSSINHHYAHNDNSYQQQREGDYYQQTPTATSQTSQQSQHHRSQQHYQQQHHQQHSQTQPIYERRGNSPVQTSGNWQNSENSVTEYYTGCPSGHTGQLPYAYDCRRFLNCWNGRGHIQTCSVGTVFNPETLECDRPDKVKCEAALGVLGVQSAGKSPAPSHGSLKQPTYRAGRYTDSTNDNVEVLCPAGAEGLQPHPSDCTRFLNCANGNMHIQQCGPGTAYSIAMKVCDFKHKVDCSGREGGDVTPTYRQVQNSANINEITCPSDASGLYPHPHDCTKFLQCSNGATYIQDCGPGTAFDSARLICDYKHKVKCCSGCTWSETETETSVVVSENHHTQATPSQPSLPANNQQHEDLPHTADILCPNGITGLFAYPFDYTKFINCKNGNTAIQNCVPGTAFSISKGYCESLEDIQQSDHVIYIVSQVSYEYSQTLITCPPGTEGLHLYPFNAELYVKCVKSQMKIVPCSNSLVFSITRRTCLPFAQVLKNERVRLLSELQTTNNYRVTEEQYRMNNMVYCPGGLTGSYPHPFDSTKYLKCVRGRLYSESCASGEAFSLSRKVCTLKEELNADDHVPLAKTPQGHEWRITDMEVTYGSIDGLTYLMCPPGLEGYFLNPFDCTKYIQCSQGVTVVDECLNGSVFSISRKECIPRDKVEAYDRVEYLTTTKNEFTNESVDQYHHDLGISCNPGTFGIYPHPHDCHKYIRCANGRLSMENCPAGQVFSLTRSFCQNEHEVDNKDRSSYNRGHYTGATTTTTNTVYQPGSYTPINVPHNSLSPPPPPTANMVPPSAVLSPPLPSPLAPVANDVNCPPGATGRYPHPYDCTKFLMCANGETHIQDCGPGTAWNKAMEVCDFKDKVDCSQSGGTSGHSSSTITTSIYNSESQFPCPAGVEGLYQHPYDWHKYLVCSHGQSTIMDCAPGTVFSLSRKICDTEANVLNTDRCNNGVYSSDYDYTYTQTHNRGSSTVNSQWTNVATSQSQPTTVVNTQISGNRWTNMNVPRPQGSTAWQHTTNTHHQIPPPKADVTPVWSGTAVHVDQHNPTHTVIYEEGTFEPNREQHSLVGVTTKTTGGHETSTSYNIHQSRPLQSERSSLKPHIHNHDHNSNWHKHHSHDTHHFKLQHNREFHEKHPNLPNPFDDTTKPTSSYNPRAESTTPRTYDFDLRAGSSRCPFDCGNGKCVEEHQVCDGVNNCGNRKDEQQCEHLGYAVRLTGGQSPNMGRVEVKILGKWGYVCDDKFGLPDADVVCHELGFKMGAMEVRGNSYYSPSDVNVYFAMDEVQCKGNETSLRECDFKGWGVNNCGPDEVVGVVCKVPKLKCPDNYWLCSTSKECIPTAFLCDVTPDCEDGSDESEQVCNAPIKYRLEGGRSSNEGRLEVFYRGEWGTVCDDDFGLKEAQVVCNSFGLYGKAEIAKNIYGPGSGPIWLDQVSCLGNETKIDECNHWSWGENNCNHTEDVGLKCTAGPKPNPAKSNKELTVNSYGKDLEYGMELEQTELDDLGLYQGLWQRSSKAVQSQKKCGHFKTNLVDEYEHPEERVVNGSVAKRGRHPWQATIRTRGRGGISSHWCGAVIISKRLILTAAHCLAGYPKGSYFVRMGDHYANIAESSEIDSNIENWYIHEKFRDQKHMNNDIALILLKTPVRFNDYVQPICLPEKGATLEPNRLCTISGWGSIKSGTSTPSNILRSAHVPILADEVCSQKNVYANAMTEGMFCAGFLDESADACDGDSGGPLVCSDEDGETLYGIISWGQHCGYVNHPGVYVRVEKYIDWIYDKINLMMQQGKL
ncbi:uncharacterized protein LOC111683246 isoform X3 [Lucilia cuprina]|uniref:uncharacterized protein LOC111683246 isoform X3 n=1 Tax=Lucilia cuprina TaxID=7375 RepID=UPI001F05CB24|nr:uncharacterized protein LOC111683246 isoform X3 [Lucilia cuprina]